MASLLKTLGGFSDSDMAPPRPFPLEGASGGGGGGGGAKEGLDQIYTGAGAVGNAINTAANALGGGGGGNPPAGTLTFKKGGYVNKNGKLNLGSGRVSTASKNKSNLNW